MTIISGKQIDIAYGNNHLLNQVDLTITEGERIGLVGRNGSGKSTLLRILADVMSPDSGDLIRRRNLTTGYLPQEFLLDESRTVHETILAGAHHVLSDLKEYEQADRLTPQRLHELEQSISAADGWNLDVRIAALMDALNVVEADRIIGTLSGGEKRRVALCRALVPNPELLILDEPTNHLDVATIEWLEEYIRKEVETLLLVTHDRYFLDRVATQVIELSHGKLYFYQGNYSAFLEQKAQRHEEELMREQKRKSFIRRELQWIQRGPKARGTKAKDRINRFYDAVNQEAPKTEGDVDLILPPPPKLGKKIAVFDYVGMSYDTEKLFDSLNFEFSPGDKIGIIGPNGVGKTTLVKILLGELKPTQGEVVIGESVRFNYIDQNRESLTDENTVFEEIGDGNDFVMFENEKIGAWGFLKRFLFEDDRINVKVSELSGGERNRLLMAKILKRGGNFLVLDEPSNDLDLPTLRILEEALDDFPGCVVVVSHDRYFLNRVCTHILAFERDGRTVLHEGDYDYYIEKRGQHYFADAQLSKKEKPEPAPAKPMPQKRKLKWKEQKELEAMEERILEAEGRVEELEEIFSAPDFFETHGERVKELNADLEDARNEVQQLSRPT